MKAKFPFFEGIAVVEMDGKQARNVKEFIMKFKRSDICSACHPPMPFEAVLEAARVHQIKNEDGKRGMLLFPGLHRQ